MSQVTGHDTVSEVKLTDHTLELRLAPFCLLVGGLQKTLKLGDTADRRQVVLLECFMKFVTISQRSIINFRVSTL